ncbi:MAG: hypothetical protein KAR44_09275 [Candidatus Aegiribacteria sp.]|nr:hypothetical protein [Candidatus Aegiribacteria sp.]
MKTYPEFIRSLFPVHHLATECNPHRVHIPFPAAQAGDGPILMSTTSRAGHGGVVDLSEALAKTADRYAFSGRFLKWDLLGRNVFRIQGECA